MIPSFSHALRLIVCVECGEALDAPVGGGTLRCDLCQAVMQLGPRADRHEPSPLSVEDERKRMAALRTQPAARPLPSELRDLTDDRGRLDPERADEAMRRWKRLRRELSAGQATGRDASARLLWLTRLLHGHLSGQGDERMLRALLETALEVLPHAADRQEARAGLAIEAVRVGDLPAAEEWLAPADPRCPERAADSAYRHAAALIATARGREQDALAIVGDSAAAIAATSERDAALSLLRAHALERLGRQADADRELNEAAARLGGLAALEEQARAHAQLALCRRSLPRLRAKARRVRGSSPWPWLGLSALLLIASVAVESSATAAGHRIDMLLFVLGAALAVPAGIAAARSR